MARGWSRNYTHQKARLDIREFQSGRSGRENLLQPGNTIYGHRLNSGHSVKIRVRSDHVEVEYNVDERDEPVSRSISVPMSSTQCQLGGARTWWLCPRCSKRVAVLYGWGRFHCRQCMDLHYRSQSETDADRSLRRAGKLRNRLGWEPGIINPHGGKPRGMHWKTYRQLQARCQTEEVKALGEIGAFLGKLTGGGMRESVFSERPAGPTSKRTSVKPRGMPQEPDVGVQRPTERPISRDFLPSARGNISGSVQCRDCANLSAGFTCLSPDSGQLVPTLGEWRDCRSFVRLCSGGDGRI